jgi:hypothetical protein
MKRLWAGLGISLALVGIVAGATLGIASYLDRTSEESDPKLAQGLGSDNVGIDQVGSATRTERYPGFSFCVEAIGVDQALEAVAKARLETALLEVVQHPYWNIRKMLASVPPLVEVGCPSDPLIARSGVNWDGPNFYARGDIHQYDVVEPSFHWTFVYLMPADQITKLLGGQSVRLAPQEYTASGDQRFLETTALFLSPEDIDDPSFLVKQLLIAVGLEPAFPESEFPDRSHR